MNLPHFSVHSTFFVIKNASYKICFSQAIEKNLISAMGRFPEILNQILMFSITTFGNKNKPICESVLFVIVCNY